MGGLLGFGGGVELGVEGVETVGRRGRRRAAAESGCEDP